MRTNTRKGKMQNKAIVNPILTDPWATYDMPFDLQKRIIKKDEYGIEQEEWETIGHYYGRIKWTNAAWRPKHSKEFEIGRHEEYHQLGAITTQWRPEFETVNHRIKIEDKIYNIVDIENIEQKNLFTVLTIYEEVTNG